MVTSPDSLQVLVPVYHLILLLLASLAPLIQLLIRKGGRERGKEGGEGRGERERTTERGREERRREKELKGELLQVHVYMYMHTIIKDLIFLEGEFQGVFCITVI